MIHRHSPPPPTDHRPPAPVLARATRDAPCAEDVQASSKVPWMIFLALTVAIALVSIAGFRWYQLDVQRAVQQNLLSITEAKVNHFLAWREERRENGKALVNDPGFRAEFQRWIAAGATDKAEEERLRQRLLAIRDAYAYEDILLFDGELRQVLSTRPHAASPAAEAMRQAAEALHSGAVEYSDITYLRSGSREHARINILAPVHPPGTQAGAAIGLVLLRADPTLKLFATLSTWPMPSESGETFLARRDGEVITYLSAVRQPSANGAALQFSMQEKELLSAQTARGAEGFLEGTDYREVRVFGASRSIPDTSWIIVSKIDKAEIEEPIRRIAWLVSVVTLLFIGGAGAATTIWWRNQRSSLLADVYRARWQEQASRQRLENITKYANDIILLLDEHHHIVEANERAVEAYGYALAELRGMHTIELRDATARGRFEDDRNYWTTAGSTYETVQRHRSGRAFAVEVSGRVVALDGQRYHLAIIRDISERKRAEATIRDREEQLDLYAKVFEHSGEGIMICDSKNRIVAVNSGFTRLTGYCIDDLQGKNPSVLASGETPRDTYRELWSSIKRDDYWQGEVLNRRKDGTLLPEWLNISVVRNDKGKRSHFIAAFTDISELKAAESEIRYLAHHDALTGLLNRYSLQSRLEQALSTVRREQQMLAVLLLDLDQFKSINDTLGHAMGDKLLKLVAQRLHDSVRDSDIVSRLGGDEFVIVLTDLGGASASAALRVADKIRRALAQPYFIDTEVLHITPSIGLAVYPSDGGDCETLVKNADVAMYHAKAQGRNNIQFFNPQMNQAAMERSRMSQALRVALDEGQFELHYQAQLDTRSRAVVGFEALIRWRHPVEGLISPQEFIPVAEDTSLILPLGEWVLDEACRQLREWQDAGMNGVTMAINLSAHQLRSPKLVSHVAATLEKHRLQGADIELEITESVAMHNPEASIKQLQALRNLGLRLSIDDFGTGYSSLSYLKLLPIQTLKLDRSFVRDIETDVNNVIICTTTIALAHSLGLKVVGEGVETTAQHNLLKAHGCDLVQGFLFSKPLTAALVPGFVDENLASRMQIVYA